MEEGCLWPHLSGSLSSIIGLVETNESNLVESKEGQRGEVFINNQMVITTRAMNWIAQLLEILFACADNLIHTRTRAMSSPKNMTSETK